MKVLFIGLGGIGQRHLRNLLLLRKDVEIYALRKRGEQIVLNDKLQPIEGETLEEKYKIHTVKTLVEANTIGVKTVFICNPSSMHIEFILEAVRMNWHVFVEKPLSHTLDKMEDLKKGLKNSSSTSMIGFQNRFHPCIKKAKELISQNKLGKICYVNAEIGENVTKWHPFEDYRRMYACKKALGGGVVLSQIHELDYLYYFFGMPKTIYASGGKLSELEIEVEDVADILMQYNFGGRNFPIHVHEDYLQLPPSRKCKIQGTEGLLIFDLLNSTIEMYDKDGLCIYHEQFTFNRNDMFIEELEDFLTGIETKKTSSIPIEEGIKSLEIAMGIKESMRNGSIITMGA